MNVLALSNVVFAQGGTEDQFGGNFGHLSRSDDLDGDNDGEAVVKPKNKTQNKLLSSQYSNVLAGTSDNFANLERCDEVDDDLKDDFFGGLGEEQKQLASDAAASPEGDSTTTTT